MADPVTDNQIIDWQPDAATSDTNLPQGASSMAPGGATELAGELRVIKSVCREESVNKSWERWSGLYGTLTIVDATHFTLSGNQLTSNVADPGPVEVNRRIKAIFPSSDPLYGYISACVFATGTTTVTVIMDSGALDNTITEIQFGVPLDIALPEDVLRTSTAPLYGVAAGTDTYTVTIPAVGAVLVVGQAYAVKFPNASTSAVTLNVNSIGAVPITDNAGNQLGAGGIPAGALLDLLFDGGHFQSVGMSSGGAVTTLDVQAGSIGTPASTVETNLFAYSMPGNQLALDGQYLQLVVQIQSNGQSGNRYRLYFGTTVILDLTAQFNIAAFSCELRATIVRTGPANQRITATWEHNQAWGLSNSFASAPTETLSGAILLKLTGKNGAPTANSIVGNIWIVQLGG
jgi:hypothetical protein